MLSIAGGKRKKLKKATTVEDNRTWTEHHYMASLGTRTLTPPRGDSDQVTFASQITSFVGHFTL